MTNTPTIHIFLNPKGGIGKSTMAAWFSQWKMQSKQAVEVLDTDDTSASVTKFKSLPSTRFAVIENREMNIQALDSLWRKCMTTEHDLILDTGSGATFATFVKGMENAGIAEALRSTGKQLLLHTVIAGGSNQNSSAMALHDLVKMFPGTPFIVWNNPYGGAFDADGKDFEEVGVYKKNAAAIQGIVNVPVVEDNYGGVEVRQMLKDFHTFDEALEKGDWLIKTRLLKVKARLYDAISIGNAGP